MVTRLHVRCIADRKRKNSATYQSGITYIYSPGTSALSPCMYVKILGRTSPQYGLISFMKALSNTKVTKYCKHSVLRTL